jgi:hypothetical protein
MSFLLDKPMIVRIVPILYAILGVFMLYIAAVNISDIVFAVISATIGVFCLVCLYLVQTRKWYSWHVALASFIIFAVYMAYVYLESSDIIWLILLFIDLMIIISWTVKFTRQYFDAAA